MKIINKKIKFLDELKFKNTNLLELKKNTKSKLKKLIIYKNKNRKIYLSL